MAIDERDEDVAHREAEHAIVDDGKAAAPPSSDEPGESPVERRPGELEQAPVRHDG